jgi:hypothetical protein
MNPFLLHKRMRKREVILVPLWRKSMKIFFFRVFLFEKGSPIELRQKRKFYSKSKQIAPLWVLWMLSMNKKLLNQQQVNEKKIAKGFFFWGNLTFKIAAVLHCYEYFTILICIIIRFISFERCSSRSSVGKDISFCII